MAPRKKPEFDKCRDMRRRLYKGGVHDPQVASKPGVPEEWRTERCDVPLLTQRERQAGRCQWCADNHKHAEDQPDAARSRSAA